jgi:hypothetical protein
MNRALILPPQYLSLGGQLSQLRFGAREQIGVPTSQCGNLGILCLELAHVRGQCLLLVPQSMEGGA